MRFQGILIVFIYSLNCYCQYDIPKIMEDGKFALLRKDYVSAIKYYNNVINSRPNIHEAYYNRSKAKFELNDYIGAELDLSSSIELNPFFFDAYSLRGLCRLNLKKYFEASRDFNKCIAFNSDDINVWSNLACCYLLINNYCKADSVCDVIISQWPHTPSGYILKAKCQYNLKNDRLFKQLLDFVINISPYNQEALDMLAFSYMQKGEWSSASDYFSRSLHLNPNNSNNLVYRGLCYVGSGDFYKALTDFNNALSVKPANICGLYNRGILSYVLGDVSKAFHDFNLLCKNPINESSAIAFNNAINNNEIIEFPIHPLDKNDVRYLSDTMIINRNKYVVNDSDMLILCKPSILENKIIKDISTLYAPLPPHNLSEFENEAYNYPVLFKKGYESLLKKDYFNAIEFYNESIQNCPEIYESYYNRAYAFFKTLKYENAISDLNMAINLNSSYAEAYYNRGILYLRMRNNDKARLDFSKAGELGITFSYTIIKALNE